MCGDIEPIGRCIPELQDSVCDWPTPQSDPKTLAIGDM